MAIFEIAANGINPLIATNFTSINLLERRDLQRLIRNRIDVIAPNTLVISEEFGDWEDSRRRIDLVGIDKDAKLVVIELKRTEDGGHMDLQAIRYASMISKMTFDRAVDIFAHHLILMESSEDPRAALLEFLGWDEPIEDEFAQDVRIVLAAAEFSKEITTTVLWLIEHDIDIRCVRLKPYLLENRVLIDVQQLIPLPDTVDYQVQLREKVKIEREARFGARDYTKFSVRLGNQFHQSVNKRRAIFLVCKHLVAKGISPDEISKQIDWRSVNSVWYFVDGLVKVDEFLDLALQKAKSFPKNFDRRRWFCNDGELLHFNNRTYALTNQWGEKTQIALERLKNTFQMHDFSVDSTT